MSVELTMLAWTAALTAVLWVPYILQRLLTYGLADTLSYRKDDEPIAAWAERAKRAHYNAVENLVPFAALVLIAQLTNQTSDATATAAVIYFWARLAHYLVYTAGIPFGRTITFAIAWLATIWIFVEVMT